MSKDIYFLPEKIDPARGSKELDQKTDYQADKELFIKKAFEDDPKKGLELLFREYYAPLCSHAVRFVYSQEIARDLVSDLFCAFYHKALYTKIDSSYRAYLYRCVRNDALKYLQREAGRYAESSGPYPLNRQTETVTPEDLLRYEELAEKIETVVKSLPPQSQKVFLMNRYQGKKYQEISSELQISTKTVEAHMTKALSILRKALQTDWLLLVLALLD